MPAIRWKAGRIEACQYAVRCGELFASLVVASPGSASAAIAMVLTESQKASLGSVAPDFSLKGVDGQTYSLSEVKGDKGLVVLFICNHCPFVVAIKSQLAKYGKEIQVRAAPPPPPVRRELSSSHAGLASKRTSRRWE